MAEVRPEESADLEETDQPFENEKILKIKEDDEVCVAS